MAAPAPPLAHDHVRAMLSSAFAPTPSLSLPSDFDDSRFVLPELLLDVFDYLPQRDLLSASGVCRRWRSLALAHPSFFYHLSLDVDITYDDVWQALDTFDASLRYIRTRHYRVGVAVDWSKLPELTKIKPNKRCFILASERRILSRLAVQKIMEPLVDSLAIVNKLSMVFRHPPDLDWETVFSHLSCATAPQLREFVFTVCFPGKTILAAPPSLFKGVAPKLREVTLTGVCIGFQPLPALAAASVVGVDYVEQSADLHAGLPSVRELKIQRVCDLTTLHPLAHTLRKLEFGFYLGMTDMSATLQPLARVPRTLIEVANHYSDHALGNLTLAPFFDAPHEPNLYVQLLGNSVAKVQLVVSDKHSSLEHRAEFSRTFQFTAFGDAALRVLLTNTLRPLAARIIDIGISEAFFELLPEFLSTLPVLQNVQVRWGRGDSLTPSAVSFASPNAAGNSVHCPKLRELNLSVAGNTADVEAFKKRILRLLRRS